MILSYVFAAALQAATTAAPPTTAGTPDAPLNLVPAFIGACINPGPNPDKIRETLVKAGGVAAPGQAGKDAKDPSRMSGYVFKEGGKVYSIIYNRSGTCTVVSQAVDLERSKSSLAQFVAGSTVAFDVNMPKNPPLAQGESVVAAYVLTSRTGQAGMAITLSSVTREQGKAIFLTRRIVKK